MAKQASSDKKWIDWSSIEPSAVILPSIIGLVIGGAIGVGKQLVANGESSEKIKLDPDCPCIQHWDIDLTKMLKMFMTTFHDACPEKKRSQYKEFIRHANKHFESILLCFEMLVRGEIPENEKMKEKHLANTHAVLGMNYLSKAQELVNVDMLVKMKENINIVSVKLKDHLTNINQLSI